MLEYLRKEVYKLKSELPASNYLNDQEPFLGQIFGADGILASLIPNFEKRPQQIEMAHLVFRSINDGEHLIVEAGTGVGKSLAYLVPAVYWCLTTKNRIVVSTHTVNLQQQLVNKDIPLAAQVFHDSIGSLNYALFKGRSHYLCLRKWNRVYEETLGRLQLVKPTDDELILENILDLINAGTWDGDRDNLPFNVSDNIWSSLCSESNKCMSLKCPFRDSCFYIKQRKRLEECHLIVVNHALFAAHLKVFSDTSGKTSLLPGFDVAVFDEAHHLEEVFRDSLTFELGYNHLKHLADDTLRMLSRQPFLRLVPQETRSRVESTLQECLNALENNLASLDPHVLYLALENSGETRRYTSAKSNRDKCRLTQRNLVDQRLLKSLRNLSDLIGEWTDFDLSDEERFDASALARRYSEIAQTIKTINSLEGDGYSFVYWSEMEQRGRQRNVTLKGAPLEVASYLEETLWSSLHSATLTSATLSTNNSFEYVKNLLGIEGNEAIVGSPFDFGNQACLCVPQDIRGTDPNKAIFEEYIAETILDIVDLVQGRTFVLFTSKKSLQKVSNLTRDRIEEKGYPVLVQNQMPRDALLSEFKKLGNAVLMGLDSFWEGVDVPGEALSCVVITRLPFPVPDHPIMQAREELWREQGLNPFIHYSLPVATLKLKQGFGRLIRSKTDKGAVVILDGRILTKNYGKSILKSLPPATLITNLEDITKFITYQ